MSIAKPFTFVAGQKARANEVNADFDALYAQVNSNIADIAQINRDVDLMESNKADLNGSSAQRFAVANPVNQVDAVNKQTLNKSLTNILDYINGLSIEKDTNSPNDTILINPGSCYDSTKQVMLELSNITSKQNENQGANTVYYVYIIGNATGSSIDISISNSSVEPTLPIGYTLYRKIGYFDTDSNGNISNINYYGLSSLDDIKSSFSNKSMGISGGVTTNLSSYLPSDDNIYLVWVYSFIDSSGGSRQVSASTDIARSSPINGCEGDSGRYARSETLTVLPVGKGRTIYVSNGCTLQGYMKLFRNN